jgi:hypothetical protein
MLAFKDKPASYKAAYRNLLRAYIDDNLTAAFMAKLAPAVVGSPAPASAYGRPPVRHAPAVELAKSLSLSRVASGAVVAPTLRTTSPLTEDMLYLDTLSAESVTPGPTLFLRGVGDVELRAIVCGEGKPQRILFGNTPYWITGFESNVHDVNARLKLENLIIEQLGKVPVSVDVSTEDDGSIHCKVTVLLDVNGKADKFDINDAQECMLYAMYIVEKGLVRTVIEDTYYECDEKQRFVNVLKAYDACKHMDIDEKKTMTQKHFTNLKQWDEDTAFDDTPKELLTINMICAVLQLENAVCLRELPQLLRKYARNEEMVSFSDSSEEIGFGSKGNVHSTGDYLVQL